MKILILLFIGLLSSCSTITKKETADSTEYIDSNEPKQFSIQTKIIQGNNILSAPQVTVLEGKEASIRVVEERFLPVKWVSPGRDNGNKVPAIPVFDQSTDFGINLTTVATKVKLSEHRNTIHIQGKILLNESPEMKGTKFQDNALFQESLISYSKDICHYSLFIKGGASRTIKFKSGEKEYTVEFTVSEIASSGLPEASPKSGLPDFKRL